jgi:P2 family phage contractile tail tube protein
MPNAINKLHGCNVYLDGVNYVGVASEVKLPAVKLAVKEHAPVSLFGKVDVPVGLEKMTVTITGDFEASFVAAACDGYTTRILELRSRLVEFDDEGRSVERSVKATLRVLFQGYEPTGFKNGDVVENTYTAGVLAYKLEVEDAVIHDISLLSNKHEVLGADLNAPGKGLLGI